MSIDVAQVYEKHRAAIFGYIYAKVDRDVDLAQDICGDVFTRLVEIAPRYEDRGYPITSFLYRVAHDKVCDVLRHQKRWQYTDLVPWHPDDTDITVSTLERLDNEALYQAFNDLTPEQQIVVKMRHLRGMSLRQVATTLGVSEGIVKSRAARGICALERSLRNSHMEY